VRAELGRGEQRMPAATTWWIATIWFAALAGWAARECVRFTKEGVRVEAEVVRKRATTRLLIMCAFRTDDGRVVMAERRCGKGVYNSVREGDTLSVVYIPSRPGRWVPLAGLGPVKWGWVALLALALACLVGAARC